MITRMYVNDYGTEAYAGVETDNGGDKDWGPYPSVEYALSALKSMVEDAYEASYSREQVEIVVAPFSEEDDFPRDSRG